MATTFNDKAATAQNSVFQGMCYVAMSLIAADIAGNAQETPERKAWANKVLLNTLRVTAEQRALMCLRHSVVGNLTSGGGVNAQDADLLNAVLEQLANFVAIG